MAHLDRVVVQRREALAADVACRCGRASRDVLVSRCRRSASRSNTIMLTNRTRLVVIAAATALGLWRTLTGSSLSGLLFLVAAAILGLGYFRYGPVWLAMRALGRGDTGAAASHLSSISDPQRLGRQSRAYFEMASGLVAAHHGHRGDAERHMRGALDLPLRTENDRALAELTLAELLVGTANAEASHLLARAAERSTRPQVDAEVRRVRELLRAATRHDRC
jgi:hypothetical protein